MPGLSRGLGGLPFGAASSAYMRSRVPAFAGMTLWV